MKNIILIITLIAFTEPVNHLLAMELVQQEVSKANELSKEIAETEEAMESYKIKALKEHSDDIDDHPNLNALHIAALNLDEPFLQDMLPKLQRLQLSQYLNKEVNNNETALQLLLIDYKYNNQDKKITLDQITRLLDLFLKTGTKPNLDDCKATIGFLLWGHPISKSIFKSADCPVILAVCTWIHENYESFSDDDHNALICSSVIITSHDCKKSHLPTSNKNLNLPKSINGLEKKLGLLGILPNEILLEIALYCIDWNATTLSNAFNSLGKLSQTNKYLYALTHEKFYNVKPIIELRQKIRTFKNKIALHLEIYKNAYEKDVEPGYWVNYDTTWNALHCAIAQDDQQFITQYLPKLSAHKMFEHINKKARYNCTYDYLELTPLEMLVHKKLFTAPSHNDFTLHDDIYFFFNNGAQICGTDLIKRTYNRGFLKTAHLLFTKLSCNEIKEVYESQKE